MENYAVKNWLMENYAVKNWLMENYAVKNWLMENYAVKYWVNGADKMVLLRGIQLILVQRF
jgi:hypothetical protein